jgi:transglutaminase-like putative cysteine protease
MFKKKAWILGILLMILIFFLTACSSDWSKYLMMVTDSSEEATQQEDSSSEEVTKKQKETKEQSKEEKVQVPDWKYVDFSEIDWNDILPYSRSESILGKPGYAYQLASEEEQQTYEEMYYAAVTFSDDYELTTTDLDLVKRVFSYMSDDHPELFWVKGYQVTHTSVGGQIKKINFSIHKEKEESEVKELQPQIVSYVQKCMEGIQEDWTDYEKARYVYEYIIKNTTYQLNSTDNQNICSVFLYGESVCQGYSVATQYLLQVLGIPCETITGEVVDRGSHAWNLLQINGEYCYMDTTWGSPSFSESVQNADNVILYDYFCVSGDDLGATHKADGSIPLPDSTSDAYNYFNQCDMIYDNWDADKFEQNLREAVEEGKNYISIRFNTEALQAEVVEDLCKNSGFFSYMNQVSSDEYTSGGKSITYFENEKLYILTFVWNS